MGSKVIEGIVTIATAVIGVAIIAVIVGSKQTSGVISSAGNALSGIISAAVKPVSGGGIA